MYEKTDLKTMLDVYLRFEDKESLRKKIKFLIDDLGFETVEEFLKDEKYITRAVKSRDLELVKLLYTNGSIFPISLLKIAIDNSDMDMVSFLLDAGIDINDKIFAEERCYEPIAYLAQNYDKRWYEIADKMLKLGANPNAKIDGSTIIEYYLKYDDVKDKLDFISLLLKSGAFLDMSDMYNSFHAAQKLDLETFQSVTKEDYHFFFAIDGAIAGNNKYTLMHILITHSELIIFSLNNAIDKNADISILNTILDFNIPKYQLKAEIKHLKSIKHRIDTHKYNQMLKTLKHIKRKSK